MIAKVERGKIYPRRASWKNVRCLCTEKTLQWLKSVPQLFQQKQWIGQMKQMWCITFTCFNKYLGLLPRWTNIEILIKHKFYLNYIYELWQNQVWQVFIKYDLIPGLTTIHQIRLSPGLTCRTCSSATTSRKWTPLCNKGWLQERIMQYSKYTICISRKEKVAIKACFKKEVSQKSCQAFF